MLDEKSAHLQTKLHRPRVPSDLVSRPRLMELLNQGLDGRITLVSAPAGFGKTTLISSWIESLTKRETGTTSPLPAAWLSLDEFDSDLNLFLRYFIAALRTIFSEACTETEKLLFAQPQPPLTVLSRTLGNEIERLAEHFILVLDDYHSIQGEAVHNLFNEWVRYWPRPLHLVLIARKDPPLPLAGLRARGKISEIRTEDLRFTENETITFLDRALVKSLSDSAIDMLNKRSEGWITGLRLASLSIRMAGNTEDTLGSLPVAASGIADYLLDEALSNQLPSIQIFLLKTSILNRFCAPLCEAVIGECGPASNARASIEWIESNNLFITPLDSNKQWYSYNPLFQEFLQNRLSAELEPDHVNELHHRAASWFAGQRLLEEALHHALEAQDLDLATRLMEQGLRDVLNRNDRSTLERWLGLLPEEMVQRRPGLLMIKAWAQEFLWRLDLQEKVLHQIEELLDSDGGASLPADDLKILRGQILVFRGQQAYFSNQPARGIALLQQALALLPPSWIYVRGGAMLFLGMSIRANGQGLAAEQMYLEEYESHGDKTDIYALYLLLGLCFNYSKSGQVEQTRRIAQMLLQGATCRRLAVLQSWAHHFLGLVHYQWNELEAAAQHFTQIVENRYTAQITALRDAVAGLALIYQTRGESSEARPMVELISQFDLEQRGIEDERTRSLRARLMLLQGDLEGANRWADAFTDLPPDRPLMWLEEPQVTRARILVARGADADLRSALQILDVLGEIAERTYNIPYKIEILALRALALDAQGETSQADAVLKQAVDLSRLGGIIRVFADLGKPMQEMLRRIEKQDQPKETIRRILAAFPEGDKNLVGSARLLALSNSNLAEPLTPRELEVLILLREPLSNKEIAHKLKLSYATVKRHTINLYAKLGVNQRWEAVARAEELNILPSR